MASATDGAAPNSPAKLFGFSKSAMIAKAETTIPPRRNRTTIWIIALPDLTNFRAWSCPFKPSTRYSFPEHYAARLLRDDLGLAAAFCSCSSLIISFRFTFSLKASIFLSVAFSSFRFWLRSCATFVCFISRAMSTRDSYSQISLPHRRACRRRRWLRRA